MENKLLTYILQMQKQSSTQSVPRLAKAQTGITMNTESGTYKPTAKVVTQADIKRQQEEARRQEEQARKDKLNAAVKRQRENQSYISQDNRTYGERENDRIKGMNAQMQEIQRNSPLAQTFGSFTPSGYNPGAGSVAANQFVRTMPLIAAGAAGATALPSIMAGLNAPIAGVAGLTGNNIMNAGFAYEAAKNLPNVGRSIKTAYQNPTLGNIGDATAETALTALNALPFTAEASKGVAPLANEIKNAFTLTAAQKNLRDLNYAKKVYGPLGYQIPENLERIAQSDVLTDRTVRGLVNRDNSVYRGVNSDLEALKERLVRNNKLMSKFTGKTPQEAIDQYDVLIKNLKKANVDINNPEEIAKYMATHIPAETGAGRAYLDPDVMKKRGISGLYTSNSKGTAEGYTYGEGYVVKAKKPTDFSSTSRKAWIDNNIPDIQTGNDYKYSRFFPKPITWKTDYQINNSKTLANYREKLGRQKLEADYPSTTTEYNGETWDAIHPEVRRVQDRRDQLRKISEEEYSLAADPYKEKLFTVEDRLKRRSENYKLNNTSTFKRVLNVPITMRDLIMESHYSRKVQNLSTKNTDAWNDATLAAYLEKYPELANAYPEVNPYAHYIHIGKPGQKVLEPVSLKKITPETWIHKSRGHEGVHSRQATRREFGGMYGSGGPIVDPMGQWAHPGQVTRIPSANITMQGVPYPVLGVASNGQQVMMQPGQDYNFGGASYVDEYPMMQNGGFFDKYPEPMRQDATRNVIPRKMTDRERLEAFVYSDQAQKRALTNTKEVIAERKKNISTKGDLNTPGSWNIKEKARLFPNSVGRAGEMFDEYVNPATYVGIFGDALGESVAARDPKGVALSLAMAAGAGAMGLDPLGGGIKAVKSLTKQLPNAAKYTAGSMYKTYNENIYPILNKEKLAPYADKITKLNEMNAATRESLKSGELRKRLINQGLTEEEVSNMKVPNLAFFADNKSPGTSYSRYQDVNNSLKLEGININFDQLNRLKDNGISLEAAYEHEVGHFLQRPLANKNPLNDLNKYNELLKNYKKDVRIYKKEGKKLANDYGLDKNKVIKDDDKERYRLYLRAMREKDEAAVNWFDRKPQLPERPNYESELDKKVRDLNFNSENSFSNYFNKDHEAYPFLREMRQTMVDQGFIKDKYQDMNKDVISNFLNSKTKNRLKGILSRKEKESNTDILHTLFKNLPAVAPAVIASQSQEMPEMGRGGYTVTRSSDRKGKTHKVTGPGGVVKYFGDSKLGQHPKDPERKKAFYARHKSNLAGNPFFRAFARKTWEDGGTIPQYQFAGAVSSTDSLRHQAAKMMDFEARKGSAIGKGLSNWGYHQSQMPYNMQSPNWKQPTTKDEAVNMYMQEIAPRLQNFPSAMEKGEAGDFLYNTGRDPRVYMLDQYLKSKGQSGIPNRGAYNVDTKTPAWTPQLQQSLNDEWKRNQDDIYKLPVNDRRVLLNKGRDFYYQNINKKADGTPNDSYKATWKPRIWESVNTYKKGGQTDDDREMLSGVADMLRRVNDVNNRKQIANYMMDNFRDEDVTFEPNKFLRSANAFGNGIPKAQTGREVKKKYVMPQDIVDFHNYIMAKDEKANQEKLAAMRQYYINSGLPYFTENKSPREKAEPWTDPVLGRIERENNEKYADRDGGFENFAEFLDPTGISSWDDVGRTFRNPSASNFDRGFALFSALPIVGKLGKLAKGTKAVNTAVKGNALQKIGRGALKGVTKTVDIVTGGPAMRYFDQSINPLSRGFGTLTEKAVGQIPYSGLRKVFEIGSDFNQMRRFQDAVLSPGYNYLDKYMTQPANSQKPWWQQ